jgi:oligogalacturonide lyase
MAGSGNRISRRGFLWVAGAAGALAAQTAPNRAFASELQHYADPSTELTVYRLTDPSYSSGLPAYYNRAIARNGSSLLFASDRTGAPQAFRMELRGGEMRQLTDAEALDGETLTLTPDNRSFCYFAGRSLFVALLSSLRERKLYSVPDGWERCPGMSVGPDGTHAIFAERRGETSRLRMVPLVQGAARTVVEARFPIEHPVARPLRAQILYRQGDTGLWLVNADGQQNRQLKAAPGRIVSPKWADDGRTIQYLNLPEDPKELHAIHDSTPDGNSDKLVAKTSQFACFSANHDTSVFVGASANAGSPDILLLLRVTRRELTLCEHKASRPEMVCPVFSPDSQRIVFLSDREGKPAVYSMRLERWVEKTDAGD